MEDELLLDWTKTIHVSLKTEITEMTVFVKLFLLKRSKLDSRIAGRGVMTGHIFTRSLGTINDISSGFRS
jgi:hypothetical protein